MCPVTDATASALADALRDRYTLERELGRGGMATVYLARDLRHDRPVALKVMHPDLATAIGTERFLREVRTTARLQHPHILPLHDSGEAARLLYYVMPYVQGESLRDRLRREGQLPLEDALAIARVVADALSFAHSQGIVHRDVKPENILLAGGHAYIADFGIARALEAAGGQLTASGMAVGTPAYMSPEQAGAGPVDARTDVYALGCVLYEMLAGEPPYTGPTPQAVLAKRVLEPVPHVRTLRETVPEALERTLLRALAKSPADRFQSAAELRDALAGGLAPPGVTTVAAGVTEPRPGPARSRRWWLAAAALVLLGSAAVWLVGRGPAPPARPAQPVSPDPIGCH